MPSAISRAGKATRGSRFASASRSAASGSWLSSSDSECEYGRTTWAWTRAGPRRSRQYATASRIAARLASGIAPVDLADEQVGERADELRDAAPRGLHLHRDRDRVAVVLDDVDDRDLAVAGGVEALPELALGRGPVAGRAVDDLVLLLAAQHAGLGAAHGLEELGAGGGGLGHDVQAAVTPVRGHLPAARVGVVLRPHRGEEHLGGGHPELEHQRPVPVVGVEPVVPGTHGHAGGHQDGLVAGPADLEEDLVLPLELDLLVVDPAGQVHRPVDREEGPAVEALEPVVDGLRGQSFLAFATFYPGLTGSAATYNRSIQTWR